MLSAGAFVGILVMANKDRILLIGKKRPEAD
jgi:hypothetical protein